MLLNFEIYIQEIARKTISFLNRKKADEKL